MRERGGRESRANECRPKPVRAAWSDRAGRRFARRLPSLLAGIDLDQLVQHLQRVLARALEGVAADDRTVAAAVADAARLVVDAVEILRGTAGEDDDALAVEAGLHD